MNKSNKYVDYSKVEKEVRAMLICAHESEEATIRLAYFKEEYRLYKRLLSAEDKVLVVGSGLGHDSYEIASYAKEVLGIDYLANYVKEAKQNNTHKNANFLCADVYDLPKSCTGFDVSVVNMGTLGNLEDPQKALSNLLSVSDVVLADFYLSGLDRQKMRVTMYEQERPGHIIGYNEFEVYDGLGFYSRSYSRNEIKDLAKAASSEVIFHDFKPLEFELDDGIHTINNFAVVAEFNKKGE